MVPEQAKKIKSKAKLEELIKTHKFVAIIEGNLNEQSSQESTDLINLLNENQKIFFTANSLNFDEECKSFLKDTFGIDSFKDQLFINGNHIGNTEKFKEWITQNPSEKPKTEEEILNEKLRALVNKDKIVLFLKGTPDMPVCGFSQRVVDVLSQYNIPYGHFNILEDVSVREGLKKFSNWNTFPQLYVKGKLVGGHDIILELHEDDDL